MILQTWHSGEGGGRVLEGKKIHQEGVHEVSFLFVDNVISGSDIFELVICLIGTV